MTAPTVLIAPDKFKGSLTAAEVADALAEGILSARPDAQIRRLPLADGGDGSVAAALAAGFRSQRVEVTGPLGDPATATTAWDGRTAVVEAATTSGLQMVPEAQCDALAASSLGFGQAARSAVDQGARSIVLALGGSASTDGGMGLLAGLGWRFLGDDGAELAPSGAALTEIAAVDLSAATELSGLELITASDVLNPLLGPTGAAAVYAPQKGASQEQVAQLEAGLAHLVDVLEQTHPGVRQLAERPSAGAAGGLGFAAMLLGAQVVSGAEFFLDLLDFDTACRGCDLVLTGEGRMDEQTLQGKLPAVVAARAAPVRVEAVVGRSDLPSSSPESGIARIRTLAERTDEDTSADPQLSARLLLEVGREIAQGLPVR